MAATTGGFGDDGFGFGGPLEWLLAAFAWLVALKGAYEALRTIYRLAKRLIRL